MMEPFVNFTGLVAPINRPNVDTDAIIPKQYLRSIQRTGFGVNLFDDWRYLDPADIATFPKKRRLNPDFVLNKPRFQHANILVCRENFGCGSSREHAVWALLDYGIKALIAPSYSDIFFTNSCKNGLLLIRLAAEKIDEIFAMVNAIPGYQLTVDLQQQIITTNDNHTYSFKMDPGIKENLLNGRDDIAITLGYSEDIRAYELQRIKSAPWLFTDLKRPKN